MSLEHKNVERCSKSSPSPTPWYLLFRTLVGRAEFRWRFQRISSPSSNQVCEVKCGGSPEEFLEFTLFLLLACFVLLRRPCALGGEVTLEYLMVKSKGSGRKPKSHTLT